jgi:hypothetical protein
VNKLNRNQGMGNEKDTQTHTCMRVHLITPHHYRREMCVSAIRHPHLLICQLRKGKEMKMLQQEDMHIPVPYLILMESDLMPATKPQNCKTGAASADAAANVMCIGSDSLIACVREEIHIQVQDQRSSVTLTFHGLNTQCRQEDRTDKRKTLHQIPAVS